MTQLAACRLGEGRGDAILPVALTAQGRCI